MQVRTFLINCCSDFNKLFFRICSKKNVRMHRFHAKLVLSVSFPFFAFIAEYTTFSRNSLEQPIFHP